MESSLLSPWAPAQGNRHEFNPSTPHQAGTSPLECWYSGVVNQTAYSTLSFGADFISARLVVFGRSGLFDRIAFEVTTGAGGGSGGVARCGIYKTVSDRNLYPGDLVYDGGEQSTEAAAVMSTTPSPAVFLAAGAYWLCYQSGVATATVRAIAVGSATPMLGLPTTIGANPNTRLLVARAYAALPATFPAGGTPTAGTVPAVHLRFSS